MESTTYNTTSINYFSTNASQNTQMVQPLNISSNNNPSASKRKYENDNEEFGRSKRIRTTTSPMKEESFWQQQQERNMPAITYASPDYKPFQLSAYATANMGHSYNHYYTPPTSDIAPINICEQEDTAMEEDDSTDEDEVLQTPMACFPSYIPHDVEIDIDQGGFTGSLERGWSEMFNEMI